MSRMVLRKPSFWLLLTAQLALCVAAGCGGGGEKVKKFDFTYAHGHFRGVIYATESPASGENSMYTVDFTITDNHSYISQDISTYQSTTEGTGGQIKGVLGYSNNGTKSLESFIFAEMYRNNIPNQSEHDEGFSFLFGPPTNNGTHYENGTRYEGVLTEIKISNDGYYGYEGPRHKAVFDKVP